jgi:DNA-binding NtrC family response regulator
MSRAKRVLIVEDEPNVRLVFRTALESTGLELATAEDGEAALRVLKKAPADMVLLDLQMPNLDGMGLLRRLRAQGDDVPVVIVTAHGDVPHAVEAMKLGALDFLAKPLTPEALRSTVDEVLARHARPRPAEPGAPAAPATAAGLLSQAKQDLNRRQFDHAETLLSEAAHGHRSAEAHYLLGVIHEMRGKPDAAYASYRAALAADPSYEPARLHLMKFYHDRVM